MPRRLDDRSRQLLKTLIERYIAEGQPVGSRALARISGLELSPATVQTHGRNAKAKLGARTRAQAVALALQGGMIDIT